MKLFDLFKKKDKAYNGKVYAVISLGCYINCVFDSKEKAKTFFKKQKKIDRFLEIKEMSRDDVSGWFIH